MNSLRLLPTPDQIRAIDPDRYLAGLFVPVEKRGLYFLLCAFNHELARAREVASMGMLALIRLQWWREVVQGTWRRHEVAEPLWQALEDGLLDRDALLVMIDSREFEADDSITDSTSFTAYVSGTAGGFAVAAGKLLGAAESDLHRLKQLGAVYGTAGQVANVSALARQGRCHLPEDQLQSFGLSGDHVRHDPNCAAPVIAALSAQALEMYQKMRGPISRQIIPAVLPCTLAVRDLRRGAHRRLLPDTLAVIGAVISGRI